MTDNHQPRTDAGIHELLTGAGFALEDMGSAPRLYCYDSPTGAAHIVVSSGEGCGESTTESDWLLGVYQGRWADTLALDMVFSLEPAHSPFGLAGAVEAARAFVDRLPPAETSPPMDVLCYFLIRFPGVTIDDSSLAGALRSMPLNSTCGDDCRRAIDAGAALAAADKLAHGEHGHSRTVALIAAGLCGTYICG